MTLAADEALLLPVPRMLLLCCNSDTIIILSCGWVAPACAACCSRYGFIILVVLGVLDVLLLWFAAVVARCPPLVEVES